MEERKETAVRVRTERRMRGEWRNQKGRRERDEIDERRKRRRMRKVERMRAKRLWRTRGETMEMNIKKEVRSRQKRGEI